MEQPMNNAALNRAIGLIDEAMPRLSEAIGLLKKGYGLDAPEVSALRLLVVSLRIQADAIEEGMA